MSDSQWDAKLKDFLKRTGQDFKRFGKDVKSEAERLLTDVKDPEKQQKMKDGLKQVGVWAKRTAEEVATVVETGVKKAETALHKASEKVKDFTTAPVHEETQPRPTVPPAPRPKPAAAERHDTPVDPPKAAKKTMGGGKKKAVRKPAAAKKTIGRKGGGPEE